MENRKTERIIDIQPLYTFFTEDTSPKDLSELIDELMNEYILLLIRAQEAEMQTIHERTYEFFFTMRTLKNILPKCEE